MELPEEAQKILDGPTPEKGSRLVTLIKVAEILAQGGATNHEILVVVEKYGSKWRALPPVSRNRFARYKLLLKVIATVRKRHPSPNEASE